MVRLRLFFLVVFICGAVIGKNIVNGSQTVLEKTVEQMFTDRSHLHQTGKSKMFPTSARQRKMCRRDPGLVNILLTAQEQALNVCEESFFYDRWNCSTTFNKKANKSVFHKVYRETAFVHALMAASITHAVARGCARGELSKCSCATQNGGRNSSWQFKRSGCGDDYKYGKRIAKNFLGINKANQTGAILKQDVVIGIDAIKGQLSEVCKCHGFSGSCTTKTCWKRLAPFSSAMGSLKKLYHHAVKRKPEYFGINRKIKNGDRTKLLYTQKSPNLCFGTKRRECRNPDNCATLCCGRGYVTRRRKIKTKCKCRMVNCCVVQCDDCMEEVDYYLCR